MKFKVGDVVKCISPATNTDVICRVEEVTEKDYKLIPLDVNHIYYFRIDYFDKSGATKLEQVVK